MNICEFDEEAVDRLRFRIIEQAVEDWRYLCGGGTARKDCNFRELIDFFKNECDRILLSERITGEMILGELMQIAGAPKY